MQKITESSLIFNVFIPSLPDPIHLCSLLILACLFSLFLYVFICLRVLHTSLINFSTDRIVICSWIIKFMVWSLINELTNINLAQVIEERSKEKSNFNPPFLFLIFLRIEKVF